MTSWVLTDLPADLHPPCLADLPADLSDLPDGLQMISADLPATHLAYLPAHLVADLPADLPTDHSTLFIFFHKY